MRGLLKLIRCEFRKLKRRKIVYALTSLAFIFPLLMALMVRTQIGPDATAEYLRGRFNFFQGCASLYGFGLLMPCLIGIMAATLFFTERDCDTFKNLQVIPITQGQLIFAKISVLYLWSFLFSALTTASIFLFAAILHVGIIYDVGFVLLSNFLYSIFIPTASLPLVALVIYFNKTYLLSVLLSLFYSIFNWGLVAILGNLSANLSNLLPVICTIAWMNGFSIHHEGLEASRTAAMAIVPSNLFLVLVMALTFLVSIGLILRFYKKWER